MKLELRSAIYYIIKAFENVRAKKLNLSRPVNPLGQKASTSSFSCSYNQFSGTLLLYVISLCTQNKRNVLTRIPKSMKGCLPDYS